MQSAWDNHALACNFAKFSPIKNIMLAMVTLPHLKYVATLPCNLSLMACFAGINVSQTCNKIRKVRWDF